jgi:hypothetical protein
MISKQYDFQFAASTTGCVPGKARLLNGDV